MNSSSGELSAVASSTPGELFAGRIAHEMSRSKPGAFSSASQHTATAVGCTQPTTVTKQPGPVAAAIAADRSASPAGPPSADRSLLDVQRRGERPMGICDAFGDFANHQVPRLKRRHLHSVDTGSR